MRIIFLLPDLPRSGAATRTVHLANVLIGRGASVDIAVFLRHVDQGLEAYLGQSGIRLLRLTSRPDRRRVRALLSSHDTVVHAAMPMAGLIGLAIARLHRRPLVYSFTNCLHTQRPLREMSILDGLKAGLERFLADSADAVHAVSHSVGEQIIRSNATAASKMHPIVHRLTPPIDDDMSATAADQVFADAFPRLLVVGRLLPHKRVIDAIHAFATVRRHWPRAKLVVLGSGPLLADLRHLADTLQLGDAVVLPGVSSNLRAYMERADLLVHPSLYEGYPRVVVEAEALGLPVVSIDSPYGREAKGKYDRVILVRPFDSGALAKAVLATLARPIPPVRPSAADDVGKRLETLYHSLLGPPAMGEAPPTPSQEGAEVAS